MKTTLLTLALALTLAGCKKHEDNVDAIDKSSLIRDRIETVEISGIEWMMHNLADPKQAEGGATFASKLPSECKGARMESIGKLYQWGTNAAWSAGGFSETASTPAVLWGDPSDSLSWEVQPCPEGFRLPTRREFKELISNCSVTRSDSWSADDCGYITLTYKNDVSKKLEFPAVGWRYYTNSSLRYYGTEGGYWSSTTLADATHKAFRFHFNKSDISTSTVFKPYGLSVRCVKGEIKPEEPEAEEPETPEEPEEEPAAGYPSVEIEGTEWMTLNLANPRQAEGGATFATKLPSECSGVREESLGKFYQWGINVAWSSVDEFDGGTPSGSWDMTTRPSDWNDNPCPEGWRLPTNTEFQNLINNCSIEYNGGWSGTDCGYTVMTYKTDQSKKVEFPAVGLRNSDGTLSGIGKNGQYWSSVTCSNIPGNVYGLWFDGYSITANNSYNEQHGLSVRCVKGDVAPEEPAAGCPTVEIEGTEWTTLNLANPRQAEGGATFATKLPSECSGMREESHGKFYRWGINVAWNSTGVVGPGTPNSVWNGASALPTEWNDQPCPDGYRLPTDTEYRKLIAGCTRTDGGGWTDSDYGYITLTSKTDPSKKLEFPAIGYRYSDSSWNAYGSWGGYWTSVATEPEYTYQMFFNNNNQLEVDTIIKRWGFPVRCVRR